MCTYAHIHMSIPHTWIASGAVEGARLSELLLFEASGAPAGSGGLDQGGEALANSWDVRVAWYTRSIPRYIYTYVYT